MSSKSAALKFALAGAVFATLQSAQVLASDPVDPAETPIVVVAPGEEVNEKGEVNNIELAQNDIDDGAQHDEATHLNDGAHGAMDDGQENTAESVQDQPHGENGQQDH